MHTFMQAIDLAFYIAILPVMIWSYLGGRWVFWKTIQALHTATGRLLSNATR